MPKSHSKRTSKHPPPKSKPKRSGQWVGATLFTLLGAGMAVIIVNYLDLFPGGTSNWRLFYGLFLISASFVVATRWH